MVSIGISPLGFYFQERANEGGAPAPSWVGLIRHHRLSNVVIGPSRGLLLMFASGGGEEEGEGAAGGGGGAGPMGGRPGRSHLFVVCLLGLRGKTTLGPFCASNFFGRVVNKKKNSQGSQNFG